MIKLENQTRAVALRWMEEIWSRRDLSVFDEIHAIDFIDHCPAGRLSDRNSYRDGIVELFRAFPDFQAVVDELIVDPVQNKAAIRWSASGTHRGSFLGKAPTGRVVLFLGIELIHVSDGKINERWGEWNESVILGQLTGPSTGHQSTGEGL